jgi:hypothetical protein
MFSLVIFRIDILYMIMYILKFKFDLLTLILNKLFKFMLLFF